MSTIFARALLGATLLVGACNPDGSRRDVVRDIGFVNSLPGPGGVPAIGSGFALDTRVITDGRCASLRVHWGDDGPWEPVITSTESFPPNSYYHPFTHTYPTRGALFGYKSVTAVGNGSTCIGEVKKRIFVTPQPASIPWALASSACEDALPAMQTTLGNVVYLVDIPPRPLGAVQPTIGQIVVGPNQVYDANGAAEVADASFPFPGWLKYSVIVMVVAPGLPGPPQLFQGGTSFSFRVAQPGSKIRLCYNSDRMPPNPALGAGVQAFQVDFRADASNAILPP